MLVLSSCSTKANFNSLACPDVVTYAPEIQKKAAEELSYPVPTLSDFMKDYHVMREQARVCKGVK